MFKKIGLIFSLILLSNAALFAQAPARKSFDSHYKIYFRNAAQDKNFYLLSLFQNHAELRKKLLKNKTLLGLSNAHADDLQKAEKCEDAACRDKVFRLSDGEIDTITKFFENPANNKKLTKMIKKDMRPSGFFIKYDEKTDAQMLALAWADAAKGLSRILDVYGLGKPPLYKDIDSASYDINSNEYKQLIKIEVKEIKLSKKPLFFEPMLAYAMRLLAANRRDEAGRHEPLERTENKKAFENLKNIKWDEFAYSVILVLGSGPSAKLGDAPNIGKIGMERSDEAVKMFQAKKAPIIILSGGYVHPMQTPYCEAIEMKKYIVEKYGIDEKFIFVDPFARHTTTNVRNAARIMFRDNIPTGKKALVTSSQTHIDYVVGDQFIKRNMEELGFVPMQIYERLSPTAAEFKPLPISLFMNSLDPLDP